MSEGQWACPQCTLLNQNTAAECGVCGYKRPKVDSQDAIAAQQLAFQSFVRSSSASPTVSSSLSSPPPSAAPSQVGSLSKSQSGRESVIAPAHSRALSGPVVPQDGKKEKSKAVGSPVLDAGPEYVIELEGADEKKKKPPFEQILAIRMWDRPDKAFTRSKLSKSSGAQLENFLKELKKIEQSYATSLFSLATKYQFMEEGSPAGCSWTGKDDEVEGKSLSLAFSSIVSQTFDRSAHFMKLSQTIDKILAQKNLPSFDKILIDPAKRFQKEIKKASETHQKEEQNLISMQKKMAALQDRVVKSNQKKGKQINPDDWRNHVSASKSKELADLDSKLKQALGTYRTAQEMYNQTITTSLDQFQQLEFTRVDGLSGAMYLISELTRELTAGLYKKSIAVVRQVRAISREKDLKEWVGGVESGKSCPWLAEEAALMFEEEKRSRAESKDSIGRLSIVSGYSENDEEKQLTQSGRSVQLERMEKKRTATRTIRKKRGGGIPTSISSASFTSVVARPSAFSSPLPATDQRPVFTPSPVRNQSPEEKSKLKEVMDQRKKEKEYENRKREKLLEESIRRQAEAEKKMKEEHEKKKLVEVEKKQKEALRQKEEQLSQKERETKLKEDELKRKELEAVEKERLLKQKELEAKEREKQLKQKEVETEELRQKILSPRRADDDGDEDGSLVTSPKGSIHRQVRSIDAEYEEIELKTPIVIDNGSAYFKAGFSGDELPSFVIPSVLASYPSPLKLKLDPASTHMSHLVGSAAQHIALGLGDKNKSIRINSMVFADTPQDWDDVEKAWQYIFDCLGSDPREHPVLVTQPALAPLKLKDQMMEILFEKFQVPCLYVATAPMLPPYAYGAISGLVVDIGHSSAQIMPVMDGYLMEAHVKRLYHLGGLKDTQRLERYLKSANPDKYPTDLHAHAMAQSIKDRLAFCPASAAAYEDEMQLMETVEGFMNKNDDDGEEGDFKEKKVLSKAEELSAGARANALTLQKELMKCGEVLFQAKTILQDQDDSIVSIPEMVAEVVKKCDVDTRRELLSNIFLSGGITTMDGFGERFLLELKNLIPYSGGSIRMMGEGRRYAVWTGGSVLSAMEGFQESWAWKEDYDEQRQERR